MRAADAVLRGFLLGVLTVGTSLPSELSASQEHGWRLSEVLRLFTYLTATRRSEVANGWVSQAVRL